MTERPNIFPASVQRDIFRRMALLKFNDERARKVIRAGRLVMPYYSYRGQEVIPSAMSACLTDEDFICTIYRGIHDMLAKGLPLKDLWAELAGRVDGTCKGKGGPMHLTYPAKGLMVTTGIVGSSLPIANGLAWSSQLDKDGRVTVAYFGDGASNIGAFHESLNLASLWKLPVVFVCQNNGFAEHTAYAAGTSAARIADRGIGYGMPAVRVDGNDPKAMHAAAREAVDRARAGEGPTLIEAMTFRFFGHIFGDDDSYMDKDEKAAAMAADPYPRYRAQMIADGIADDAALAAIEAEIEAEIDAAIDFALASAWPDEAELKRDVYEEELA
ncbi:MULTISPECIES: thiamine pyrophosphate-dependent dehydrogenase E1 component subunit alpha [unclassified Sphingobium]|uniref:thiamine pyrophosphate-dependent dehydrogenase E1 component subunit alpha n=1 Tax=unclassified Sphingobium TaxID=2611147 RepID=UPI000D172D26|nr:MULTISPECIES: thiamine pyrophosphate-dependent dehydrogenase E1 component subunit alpha [unclassified Sphingobium]MBG6119952.1 pyruvate dehydrogenase E1 component alpha subunit [Sphingobium sp. JAI105]PSO11881.1 pyruvate dehydrogenase [Sphingobium sp. AEW4]TWC99609.1 pyruvate dehydrogenase E1 component alpha subunit [Sphingobium sp. AEW010]TWD18954.1 pyruvate dehydrogenase E1 component alpha subunit [Sphingobium sp. AEW013]TWD21825.1 pyruvate dehydrogenase E1 component alpha subunit [Sphing